MIAFEGLQINPGQAYPFPAGNVFTLKSTSAPVLISFSGGPQTVAKSGRIFDVPFTSGTIVNNQSQAVIITFFIGDKAMAYSADDNAVANVKHRLYGNVGIADGAAAAGGNPQNVAGYLQITNAMHYSIPGQNLGNTRQSITFDVAAASAQSLKVEDLTGNTCQIIPPGQARQIITDSQLKISGNGGVAQVAITEVYQINN